MSNAEHLQALFDEKNVILRGDEERVSKQHAQGCCTARERVAKLFDAGSFVELGALKTQGNVVTGYGTVHDRPAYCFAQDITACGGAMSTAQTEKILALLRMAAVTGAPIVAMCDSNGAKLSDGANAMTGYAQIYHEMVRLSGVCPMIAVVYGACLGVGAMISQLCDITVQVEKSGVLALHSPLSMSAPLTVQELGGASVMAKQGAVALTAEHEDSATALLTALLDLLPACNVEDAPLVESDDLNRLMNVANAEDALSLCAEIADNGHYIELFPHYGEACKTVLCRIGGRSAGLVACAHDIDGGRLDAEACGKVARFVRLCDCYQMPIISLIHTEGLKVMQANQQAWQMRACAQMLYAYSEATSPKLSVIVGSAIGGAYVAMGGKPACDVVYAWPGAVISPLTVESAVQVLYQEQLEKDASATREALEEQYKASVDGMFAAKLGVADDCIEPAQTRKYLIAAMEMLASKRDVNPPKKHGNLPL